MNPFVMMIWLCKKYAN